MVGFLFLKTRVLGIPVPFHRDFEEVNLRFYVRRAAPDGCRRGVVFVRELVPRMAVAFAARVFYGENYLAVPMSHAIEPTSVRYGWTFRDAKTGFAWPSTATRKNSKLAPGSSSRNTTGIPRRAFGARLVPRRQPVARVGRS
jgi:uncharacterized protein YqjF (DUF2071 family)